MFSALGKKSFSVYGIILVFGVWLFYETVHVPTPKYAKRDAGKEQVMPKYHL